MLYGDHPRQLSRSIYAPNMIAIMQGSNVYAYCVNDPVTYTDASGEIAGWVILALYGYAQAVLSSPDLQFDINILAFDLSQGDYVSAAFDVVDILAPGLSGSKGILKFISKYFDDVGDAVKSSKRVKSGVKFHTQYFDEDKVMGHIFSDAHIRKGIMNLGDGKKDIYTKILDVVETTSSQFVEGENTILTVINEIETTITVNVCEGAIRGFDAYVGRSNRISQTLLILQNDLP